MSSKSVVLIAHRGYHANGAAPENSLLALGYAQSMYFYYVEFDVHLTKDNQLVLSHDANFEKLTGDTTPISEMTLEECETIKFPNGGTVPSLKTVFEDPELSAPIKEGVRVVQFFIDMKCEDGREEEYCAAMCDFFNSHDGKRVYSILSDNKKLLAMMSVCLSGAKRYTVENEDFWDDVDTDETLNQKLLSCVQFEEVKFDGACIPMDEKLYKLKNSVTKIGLYNKNESDANVYDVEAIDKIEEADNKVMFYNVDAPQTKICFLCRTLAVCRKKLP